MPARAPYPCTLVLRGPRARIGPAPDGTHGPRDPSETVGPGWYATGTSLDPRDPCRDEPKTISPGKVMASHSRADHNEHTRSSGLRSISIRCSLITGGCEEGRRARIS